MKVFILWNLIKSIEVEIFPVSFFYFYINLKPHFLIFFLISAVFSFVTFPEEDRAESPIVNAYTSSIEIKELESSDDEPMDID